MDATFLVLGALAVWRATHLLHAEAGPGQAFARLRTWAGRGPIGRTLGCFYCLSMWVAVPAALTMGSTGLEVVLLWLGMSAAASLLERVTVKAESAARPALADAALDSDFPTIQGLDAGPMATSAH
jgi:hypothetical protein